MKATRSFIRVAVLASALTLAAQVFLSVAGLPVSKAHAETELHPLAQSQSSTPIKSVLNDDGTLNLTTGFNGSLDPSGYTMQAGPNGEPRFVPQDAKKGSSSDIGKGPAPMAPGDENWDPKFGFKGLDGSVRAITVSGDSIYVGGAFNATKDGSLALNRIARWSKSESRWYALGNGFNGIVKTIVVSGDVFVGGTFTTSADGTHLFRHVARWDGTSWHAMGMGLGDAASVTSDEVRAMVALGDDIYAGGVFAKLCTPTCTNTNHVARWNKTSGTWYTVDGGVSGPTGIYDMGVSGQEVFIGGAFANAGAFAAPDVAVLNNGRWFPLGNPGGVIFGLAVSGDDIYVAGNVGGPGYCCVEKWNTTTFDWDYLMDSVHTRIDSYPVDMVISGNDLYMSGVAHLNSANPEIIKWNGASWSDVGNSGGISGCNSSDELMGVRAIAVNSGDIYTGGCFSSAPGLNESVDNIAKWSTGDSRWLGMNGGLTGLVNAVLIRGTDLYVGGSFTEAGGVKAQNIVKWDGTRWRALFGGVNGTVRALALSADGNKLYAGGDFTMAGNLSSYLNVPANHIAMLNMGAPGVAWASLGSGAENGLDDTVLTLAVNSSYVYVGGQFTHAGSYNANHVARWSLTGSRWYNLASGLNDTVNVLVLTGHDVFAGGAFTRVPAYLTPVNHIARWDGTAWNSVGTGLSNGVNDDVYIIAVSGSTLYVGGSFTQAGNTPAAHIARWSGTSWSGLGGGLDATVYSLAIVGTKVYAGGAFSGKIGIWDGTSWFALGSGIVGNFSAVLSLSADATTGDLYVGGFFVQAGGKSSRFVGLYHGQP